MKITSSFITIATFAALNKTEIPSYAIIAGFWSKYILFFQGQPYEKFFDFFMIFHVWFLAVSGPKTLKRLEIISTLAPFT